ncbi:hypothetical protein ACFPK1_21060 [Actinomycetospora rhizophila]|uniref:Protein kinase domain-containing protein n=1 Tax=Actinomycetospora rhizophila TaxID=1416876 RepID=A0ABV9ZK08_9PSEU
MTEGEPLSGGHYRLGAAVTAAVRAAHDEWDDRDVVAVALDGTGPGALTRVARDVRRAAEHPHPGLAPARDVAAGRDQALWLVHDVPAGARGLAATGPVPGPRLRAIALVLAEGLAAAHAARLVHGRVGADVVLVGPGEAESAWLLGAPSGRRPDDRPAAEDDDVRALAATLAAVPVAGDAGALRAVLERVAGEHEAAPGTLGAALLADLRALGDAPRRTEVIATPVAAEAWSPSRATTVPVPGTPAVPDRPTARVGLLPPPAPAPTRRSAPPSPPPPASPRPPAVAGPGSPRRRGPVVAGVVAAAVVLVAVVVAVALLRGTAPAAGPSDRVVPGTVGDPATVEPCALLDPAAIAPERSARIVPDLGSPASCTLDVRAPGGDVAVVATFEPVATAVSAAPEERVGPLLVRRPAPQPGSCTRTVVTTEGVQVAVDALLPPGSGADACATADAATDTTVRALQRGTPLPRRPVADPPTALTTVDTCAVLSPDDLRAVPGLDADRVAPGVGGWSCRRGGGPGGTVVDVGVERRAAFAPTTEIAGRPATVTPRGDSCDAAVAQRSYTVPGGGQRVELLEVSVLGARPVEELCADATRSAAAAVPRLPRP